MPDVVGCTRDVVDRSFKQADLGVAKAVPQADDAPTGVVFRQDPPAATRLVPGRQVTLSISTGPARPVPPESNTEPTPAATVSPIPTKQAMAAVPPVSGLAEARGMEAIRGRHLVPILGGKEFSSVAGGSMSRTDPPAGTTVPQGTLVRYWESLGPAPVPPPATPRVATVPPVTGMTPAEALAILRKAGLTAGEPIPELSLSGTGRISRQEPLAGKPPPPPGQMVLLWRSYAWFSTMGLVVVPLLILGAAAGLAFTRIGAKRRLIYTRAVLRIQPSLARDGEAQFDRTIPPAGPALGLRASLQPGEVHFTGPVPIERQEIQHD
ncbi:MAG TPA: PASTA domain-containing protein [Rhodanobacter sp.]|nr:PASTA domain-containing protein [Rhodanobacter sp.]